MAVRFRGPSVCGDLSLVAASPLHAHPKNEFMNRFGAVGKRGSQTRRERHARDALQLNATAYDPPRRFAAMPATQSPEAAKIGAIMRRQTCLTL
jgi:hypothetical protein